MLLGALSMHMLKVMFAVLDRRHTNFFLENRAEMVNAVVAHHSADPGRTVIARNQQILRLADAAVDHKLNRGNPAFLLEHM